MKAISIRQPDAWLVVNGWKDIENRAWKTQYRGVIAVHASGKAMTKGDREYLAAVCEVLGIPVPDDSELPTGGIVGLVEVVDCVTAHESVWFDGPIGWVLGKYLPVKFIPCKGKLGLFDCPVDLIFHEDHCRHLQ